MVKTKEYTVLQDESICHETITTQSIVIQQFQTTTSTILRFSFENLLQPIFQFSRKDNYLISHYFF